MDIVVISDKHNLVRRNHVVKIFGKKNLDFRFFDAVMGNRMSEKDVAAAALENTFCQSEKSAVPSVIERYMTCSCNRMIIVYLSVKTTFTLHRASI